MDVPDDILKAATAAYDAMPLVYDGWDKDAVIDCLARALLAQDKAATERAAKKAEFVIANLRAAMKPLKRVDKLTRDLVNEKIHTAEVIATAIRSQP